MPVAARLICAVATAGTLGAAIALGVPTLGAGTAAAGNAETIAASGETADLSAGRDLYKSVCRNCHGPTAKGMASFPKLAGQDAETLTILLQEYRAGETLGPNTALMAPHAKELSDADIANLAAYIATEFE